MKATLLLMLLSGLVVANAQSPASTQEIQLSQSKQAPTLHLALTVPEGWTFEWTPRATYALARLTRGASGTREMMIVTATPLTPETKSLSADEFFNVGFVRDFGSAWQAKECRRVKDAAWDGVFTLYALPESITKGKRVIEVEDWMMVCDGYRVEFNCYFEKEPSDGDDRSLAQLRSRYGEILKTVRKGSLKPRPTGT